MAYREAEQVGLKRRRSKQAIALAMEGRWSEAIAVNKDIIESFPNDVEAYNRLGKAYMELGEYLEARGAYQRAIELDPYNAVAMKNLRRLSSLGEIVSGIKGDFDKAGPEHFIEEIGKAGVVSLYHLGPPQILARLVTGDKVYLKIDGHNLIVEDGRGDYLGQIEPKHRQRLIRLMKGGNKYEAAVVSSAEDKMTIIIREVYQEPSQAGRLSFPVRGAESLRTYVSDRIFRRELEHEEEMVEESGFTIVGGEEREVFSEEPAEMDDKADNEE